MRIAALSISCVVLAGLACQTKRPGPTPVVARDTRLVFPAGALPAPGSLVPPFAFPLVAGSADSTSVLRATDLRGAPVIVALWSTYCPHQRPAMAEFAALARAYRARGVRMVVLADDAPGPALTAALDTLPWVPLTDRIAVANGQLATQFDRSSTAPPDVRFRIEFVLPSFLLLDAQGRVVRNAFGAPHGEFAPALDSLLGQTKGGAT